MIELITAASSADLTVLANAKAELLVTGTDQDTRIAALITQASGICASYCMRPEGFGLATWRETLRLSMSREAIILARDLAPAITSVVVDGVTLAAADYELDGSLLHRLTDDRLTYWAPGKVVVTYTAGFALLTDLPQEIERACLLTLQSLWAAPGRNPLVRSETAQDVGSVSYLDPRAGMEALPPQAAGLLAPWQRVSV